jgi:hypothetical protein
MTFDDLITASQIPPPEIASIHLGSYRLLSHLKRAYSPHPAEFDVQPPGLKVPVVVDTELPDDVVEFRDAAGLVVNSQRVKL